MLTLIKFEFADTTSRDELVDLLELCFQEGEEINQAFIDYGFKNNCLILKKDEKIVSALYLLDANIIENGKAEPIYYMYAVGTHPEFRGRGYMTLLLRLANDFASKNSREYIVLLPSNEKNCNYYKKFGYLDFFKVRFVEMDRQKIIETFIQNARCKNCRVDMPSKKISKIRRSMFNNNGDVIWSDKHVEFAKNFSKVCSGEFVFTKNGYAACYEVEGKTEIREIVVPDDEVCQLLNEVLKKFATEKFLIRLPVSSNLFSGEGVVKNFGMIHPTNLSKKVMDVDFPYLGLPLD